MDLLEKLLLRDEGFRKSVYLDSLGYQTIGIGRLVDMRRGGGVTFDEALYLLRNDIGARQDALHAYLPWWSTLGPVRQAVLLSMAFQLGVGGLLSFRNTLQAIEDGRYEDAAVGMLASRWASQAPLRVHRLASAMRSGDAADLQLDEDPPQHP